MDLQGEGCGTASSRACAALPLHPMLSEKESPVRNPLHQVRPVATDRFAKPTRLTYSARQL